MKLRKKYTFPAFVRKEFYHIFRDKRTMLILIGMPIVQIILFGFAISTEVRNIKLAILDPTPSELTRQVVERIDASEYFIINAFIHTPDEIDRVFQENKADMVIVFSQHFAENLYSVDGSQVQLIPDASDTNMSTTAIMYLNGIVSTFMTENMPVKNMPGVTANIRMLYNPQLKSSYNFVPGIMGLILMLICAMMTSIAIVREKEMGTMEVLLVSPVKPIYIILSKMIPYLVVSCINFATILILAVYMLDVPLAGSLFWITCLSLIFISVSLALGVLISTLTDTQMAAMLVSGAVLMIPVIMLSGMIFPVESMPWPLQYISHIVPAKWYIAAIKKLMIEGLPVRFVVKELAILVMMALFLIGVSLKKFKNRLA
jgi:ABC-2 type transport system permease protein